METKENIYTRIDILNALITLIHNDVGIGKIPISLLVENFKSILKHLSTEDFEKLSNQERKIIRKIYTNNFSILEEEIK